MRASLRKILVVGSAGAFSLALVAGILYFGSKDRVEVYSSEPKPLSADFKDQPRQSLGDWEERVLNRNSVSNPGLSYGNYTGAAAQGVVEEYLQTKQLNSEVNEEKIASNVLLKTLPENYEIEYQEYKISDLKISSKNDAGSFKTYGNRLGEASIKNAYDTTWGTEFEILTKAIQLNRETEFARLEPIIKSYQNLVSDLLAIEVPAELAATHLNIVNSLSKISATVGELGVILKDPFRGIFVMTSYARSTSDLQDYMKELNKKMKDRGASFGESEAGSSIERAANISLNIQ